MDGPPPAWQDAFRQDSSKDLLVQPSFSIPLLTQGENHNEAVRHRVFALQIAIGLPAALPPVGSGVFLKDRFFLYSVNAISFLIKIYANEFHT